MAKFDYADLIGKPFAHGGRGPESYDCYGLVREMFRRAGIETPSYLGQDEDKLAMIRILANIQKWKRIEAREGAMVLLRLPDTLHVGYIMPYGRMIHTWDRSGGVCLERFDEWKTRAIAYYDY